MKPQPIHPSEDTYNFATADAMVNWCEKNGLKVWGHTLVWHSQTAPWFFQEKNPELEKQLNLQLLLQQLQMLMFHVEAREDLEVLAAAIQARRQAVKLFWNV